jgi:hypothetical protein
VLADRIYLSLMLQEFGSPSKYNIITIIF